MKANIGIVTITPKRAEELLNYQVTCQRPLRNVWVKQLAADMEAGRFRLSCDAIVTIKGQLGNGQHRLWAVIESKKPQPFILMETDDEELYAVIDGGMKRSVGDAAQVTNGTAISASATLAYSFENKMLSIYNWLKRPTRNEVIEFIHKNEEALQSAHSTIVSLTKKRQNLVQLSVASTFLFLSRNRHGDKGEAFLYDVYDGDKPESVAWDLRERLLKIRMAKTKYYAPHLLALFVKSFAAHLKGGRPPVIRVTEQESYPTFP